VDIASKEAAYNTMVRKNIEEFDQSEKEVDGAEDTQNQFSAIDIQHGLYRNKIMKKEAEFDNL